MRRNSCGSMSRAISAIWPAISTPVGPAPTIANVNRAARRAGSASTSAASNAARILRRTSRALSSDFSSGASGRQSSWPKYEYSEPAAMMSTSYGTRIRSPLGAPGVTSTVCAATSNPVTSPRTTLTSRRRLKMARNQPRLTTRTREEHAVDLLNLAHDLGPLLGEDVKHGLGVVRLSRADDRSCRLEVVAVERPVRRLEDTHPARTQASASLRIA